MCLFYWWSHNGTSYEEGLGEVQPTKSTSFPAWKSCASSLILVIRPRSWVSHEQPHLKPCCSGAMMMLSYCMMLLMTICENLALVADNTGEGNWLEPFWMVAFLKTGVISVVLQVFRHSAATECSVDDQCHTHSRGNVVLLLVMSAVTGLK